MTLPLLSVIFPNWNGGEEPLALLASLRQSGYPAGRLEIIMVDNASSDGSPDRVARAYPDARIIRNAENRGFAAAVNQGIKTSRGDLMFITNDDVVVGPGSLTALATHLLSHPDIGIAGGTVVAKDDPTRVLFRGKTFSFWTGLQRPARNGRSAVDADFIEGACLLVRRTVIEQIGAFDERFFPAYWEDVDFCLRARHDGWRIVCLRDAIVRHKQSASLRQLALNDIFRMGLVNRYRFYRKHATLFQWASFLLFHFFISIPYRNLFVRDRSLRAEMAALRWFLTTRTE